MIYGTGLFSTIKNKTFLIDIFEKIDLKFFRSLITALIYEKKVNSLTTGFSWRTMLLYIERIETLESFNTAMESYSLEGDGLMQIGGNEGKTIPFLSSEVISSDPFETSLEKNNRDKEFWLLLPIIQL